VSQGIDAEYVNLENVVSTNHNLRNGLNQGFYDELTNALAARIAQCEDRLPVITGTFSPLLCAGASSHLGFDRILWCCSW
jgi:aspartate kinase